MSTESLWKKYREFYFESPDAAFCLDISRMDFGPDYFKQNQALWSRALEEMRDLESGKIANADESRMVGHYWLRDSKLAPNAELKQQIDSTFEDIKTFSQGVLQGKISPSNGGRFKHILVIGIGGSALGPQFVNQALGSARDPVTAYFFDNTDPDGMQKVLTSIPDLSRTLTIVISKSGGTKETRNGQLVAKKAYQNAGLAFAKYFVAVTGLGSELDQTAISEGWLARFPMWDWVGGRTSELSAVGLLPAALQGFSIDGFLNGAAAMDQMTRATDIRKNPAMLLAAMWYYTGQGRGEKAMVVLPYKDRLELFSKYLQQLVMESLGKEKDRSGKVVNQGISVYGNKGSTDQHAYVQQLRDGLNNFFAVFVEVLNDRCGKTPELFPTDTFGLEVDPGVTSGDYLFGFYEGTRRALYESKRESISIAVDEVSEKTIGMLIALFERAVGFYASFVNINAYHQPGVEAGKKAAGEVLKLQAALMQCLKSGKEAQSSEQIAKALGREADTETIYKLLRRLAKNDRIKCQKGGDSFSHKYSL